MNAPSRVAIYMLVLVCIASFALMLSAALTDSAIVDESAHIPAGYGYVHELDYRLNPEHPPLVKALAMAPVLFLAPRFPTETAAWQTEVNSQWTMGSDFLYGSGNDANAIIRTARVMPMLLTILLIILTYFLARGLMGTWWALLPAALLAFDPTILAQGHYVTTDVGAALGIVLATFFFLKFLATPSSKHLLYAGLAFGAAQLMKFSTPLLVPLFLFVTIVLGLRDAVAQWHETVRPLTTLAARLGRRLLHLAAIFAIGYVIVVYPVYALFTAHYPIAKQVSDTKAILSSFAGGPSPVGTSCHGIRCLADLNIWMSGQPFLRPVAEYMLGILMVFARAAGGNTIYFLGHVSRSGGWIYFPLLFLVKEPIPTLLIILVGLGLAITWTIKKAAASRFNIERQCIDYLGVNVAEFTMASFVVLYWGYSMRSSLNIGIRHLIPTFPFIYVLAAGVWKRWSARVTLPVGANDLSAMAASLASAMRSLASSALKYIVILALLCWLVLGTTFAAPYFLSYFNAFGGGTENGYRIVTDSNYDWGQDLLRLKQWVDAQNEICTRIETFAPCGIQRIAVDYFGGGNPRYYLGNKEVDWWSSKGNPKTQGIEWFAISINSLEQATQPLAPDLQRKPEDSYAWLTALRASSSTAEKSGGMGAVPAPDYRAGTSIFIYHL